MSRATCHILHLDDSLRNGLILYSLPVISFLAVVLVMQPEYLFGGIAALSAVTKPGERTLGFALVFLCTILGAVDCECLTDSIIMDRRYKSADLSYQSYS